MKWRVSSSYVCKELWTLVALVCSRWKWVDECLRGFLNNINTVWRWRHTTPTQWWKQRLINVNKSIDTLLTNNNISIHRNRDAPIIGIGRLSALLPIIEIGWLLCRYWPIVIYYVLWWQLDTEIIYFLNLNWRHKLSFSCYICKLGKHADSVV